MWIEKHTHVSNVIRIECSTDYIHLLSLLVFEIASLCFSNRRRHFRSKIEKARRRRQQYFLTHLSKSLPNFLITRSGCTTAQILNISTNLYGVLSLAAGLPLSEPLDRESTYS